MKYLIHRTLLICALAHAGTVFAQVPSTNDTSDGNYNTGTGTGALGGPATSNHGQYNTAAGYQAAQETTGVSNTAFGYQALLHNSYWNGNTAVGSQALYFGGEGFNTGVGAGALYGNSLGAYNTAIGASALGNSNGNYGTGSGYGALLNNAGENNTAVGFESLQGTSAGATGSNNTGIGMNALYSFSSGSDNTASGYGALYSNTTGSHNTGSGYQALFSDSTGTEDAAFGYKALYSNTTGNDNTAVGNEALYATTGSNNVALGYHTGINLTTGSNDIDIGNAGVAAESGVIRIGTAGTQTRTFVAGIDNSQITGAAVYITSSGQLGVLASSERYKTAITPMGENTTKLQRLRPVTFHLKTEPKGAVQYGLIAEEVDKVYPELVIRDENGTIEGVRYDELAPMLLNEYQKQRLAIAAQNEHAVLQARTIAFLNADMQKTKQQLAEVQALKLQLQAVLQRPQPDETRLARR